MSADFWCFVCQLEHGWGTDKTQFGVYHIGSKCLSKYMSWRSPDAGCFLCNREMEPGTTSVAILDRHLCMKCYDARVSSLTAYECRQAEKLRQETEWRQKEEESRMRREARAKKLAACRLICSATGHAMNPAEPAVFVNDAYTCVACWKTKRALDEPDPEPKKAKSEIQSN